MLVGVNNGINVIHTRNSLNNSNNNNDNNNIDSHMNDSDKIQISPPPSVMSTMHMPNGFPQQIVHEQQHGSPQLPQLMVGAHQNQQQVLPQPLQPHGLQPIINSNLQHQQQIIC
ncbi:unnamed protein product [[Candida] boidinii]|nr:unnamed protein product [[Candida] boidinii]